MLESINLVCHVSFFNMLSYFTSRVKYCSKGYGVGNYSEKGSLGAYVVNYSDLNSM